MKFVLVLQAFLAVAILSIEGADIVTPLRIGTWNAQRLGKTKMSKPEVVSIMVQVRDVVLLVIKGPRKF